MWNLTVEAPRDWIVVLDDILVDVNALCTLTRINFDRVVGTVHPV